MDNSERIKRLEDRVSDADLMERIARLAIEEAQANHKRWSKAYNDAVLALRAAKAEMQE